MVHDHLRLSASDMPSTAFSLGPSLPSAFLLPLLTTAFSFSLTLQKMVVSYDKVKGIAQHAASHQIMVQSGSPFGLRHVRYWLLIRAQSAFCLSLGSVCNPFFILTYSAEDGCEL